MVIHLCVFSGMFPEIPLWLEVLLGAMCPGHYLARNYVWAHFSLFEELQETLCDNKSGCFNRKHSGACACYPFLSLILRLTLAVNISKNQLTHWLHHARGNIHINLKKEKEKQ